MTEFGKHHANFRDPVGLLIRMLRSGNRAALAALIREASSVALSPVDRYLQTAEAERLRSAGDSIQPLLLIVGSSRAGTTLLYQVLARYLPVTYFTNLSGLFPRSPITASRVFQPRSLSPQRRLQNYYGNTIGLRGPNDGFHVWNRWLGTDRYRASTKLTQDTIDDMRRFFAAWTETFGQVFLNKNNRNADCVALLARALPEAIFVVVRRNPVDVAQSLLVARQHIQGDKRRKWGVRSFDQEPGSDPLGYVDSVCRQIVEVNRKLTEDCRTLPASQVIEVRFEDFCVDPVEHLERISGRVWGSAVDTTAARRELNLTHRSQGGLRVSPEELNRIHVSLAELAESTA